MGYIVKCVEHLNPISHLNMEQLADPNIDWDKMCEFESIEDACEWVSLNRISDRIYVIENEDGDIKFYAMIEESER